MASVTTTVEVDVDLDGFTDEEIKQEAQKRGLMDDDVDIAIAALEEAGAPEPLMEELRRWSWNPAAYALRGVA